MNENQILRRQFLKIGGVAIALILKDSSFQCLSAILSCQKMAPRFRRNFVALRYGTKKSFLLFTKSFVPDLHIERGS